jgi:hypothetical protein
MRPRAYYAVFNDGRVTAVIKGAMEARKLSPHRGYKAFKSQLAAEEFAAWFNHEQQQRDAAVHAAIRARMAAKASTRT